MTQLEVLIAEFLSVDALATCAVAAREIPALQHEVGDDTVELGVLEPEALLPCAQGAKVLRRPRGDVVVQVEVNAAGLLCRQRLLR